MKIRKFKVKGIHCKRCAKKIMRAVFSLAGIRSMNVDIAANVVLVFFDEQKASVQGIRNALQGKGFPVISEIPEGACFPVISGIKFNEVD